MLSTRNKARFMSVITILAMLFSFANVSLVAAAPAAFTVRLVRSNLGHVSNLTEAEILLATPSQQLAVFTGSPAVINYLENGGDGHFGSNLAFPGSFIGADVNFYAVEATASVFIPRAGFWTFGTSSDDGIKLTVGPLALTRDGQFPPTDTYARFNFAAAGNYPLRMVYFEHGGGAEVELFAAEGNFTSFNSSFRLVGAAGGLQLVNPDAIAPTASPSQSPSANGAGWNNSDVTVTWNWTDNAGGSGINPLLCPATNVISGEGANLSAMSSCTDIAGNLGSNTVSGIKIDRTAPNTSLTAPTGWNNVDVTLNLVPNDVLSGVGATNFILDGGAPQTGTSIAINTEGIHTIEFWSVDNAGNAETHHSAEVKIDKTPPTISHSQLPLANGNGWNNGDVTVTFVCGDALSGLASCTDPQTVTTEGQMQAVTGTAVDNAGNSATDPATVSIDKSAPTISASADRAANINGWYNADVMVSFTCEDTLSGIASCPAAQTLGEGTNQSASGTATDAAGNDSASATVSGINVDKTAPSISAAATTSPNGAGWYNGDVTIHYTCTDVGSGIPVGACPSDEVLSVEGSAITSSASTVTDAAGNTSDASNVVTVNIDKTAPTLTPVVSPNPVILNGTAAVTSGAADVLSGLASQSCGTLDTSTVGTKSVTCTATDNAGNTNSADVSYNVIYNWTGFFQPVDNLPILNVVKAGQAIPVKFSLGGNQGLSIMATGYPVSTVTACGSTATDVIETTVTAGSSSLSYDATSNQYNYVWKTDKLWAGTCRTLTVKFIDGTIHQANFNFTR